MVRFAPPGPGTTACAGYRSSAAAGMVTVQYIKAAKIDILIMTASARGHSEPVGWVERLRNPSAGFACAVARWVSLPLHPSYALLLLHRTRCSAKNMISLPGIRRQPQQP